MQLFVEKVLIPFLMVIVGVSIFDPLRSWWLGPDKYVVYLVGRQANPETKAMFDVIENSIEWKRLRIDGREIDTQDFDDEGNPQNAEEIAKDLVTQPDTLMVIGHVTSQATKAALPHYMKAVPPIPVIATRETEPDLLSGVPACTGRASYCPMLPMSPDNVDEVAMAVEWAVRDKGSRKFLIVKQNGYNQEYTDGLAAEFRKQIEVPDIRCTLVDELSVESTRASLDQVGTELAKYPTDVLVFIGKSDTAQNLLQVLGKRSPNSERAPITLMSDSAIGADPPENGDYYVMSPVSSDDAQTLGRSYGDDVVSLVKEVTDQATSEDLIKKTSWLRHLLNMHRVSDARAAISQVMREHSGGNPYMNGKYVVISGNHLENKHFHIWHIQHGLPIIDDDFRDRSTNRSHADADVAVRSFARARPLAGIKPAALPLP